MKGCLMEWSAGGLWPGECYAIPNVSLEWFMPFQIGIWNGIAFSGRFMV